MQIIKKTFILLTAFIVSCSNTSFKDGDIIFQTSKSAQSVAVQEATGSKYSHMGIIFFIDGKPFVYEASSKVRYTPLSDWIKQGEGRKYVVKRLKKGLSFNEVASMKEEAKKYQDKLYDTKFLWSDDKIYCSELVWKIYYNVLGIEIGKKQKFSEFSLGSKEVQKKIQERFGNQIPLDEYAVSPQAIFDSELLDTVYIKK